MNVHNYEEDELEQLQRIFGVLTDIQSSNDPTQTINPHNFKQTKHCQDLVLRPSKKLEEVIKRNGRQYVNQKSALEVVVPNNIQVLDLVTSYRVIKGGSKLNENIDSEQQVNEGVHNQEVGATHLLGIEGQLKRDAEGIIQSKNNYKQLPSRLIRVILLDHENVILVGYQAPDLL